MVTIEFSPDKNDFVKVLKYYDLFEPSEKYKIVCPFHADINASLMINLDEGNYYCFGCNRHGDAFNFVADANSNLSDIDKYKAYFKILKSKKVKAIDYNKSIIKKKDKKSNEQLQIIAQDYYFNLGTNNWNEVNDPIKEYMVDRGFDINTLNKVKAKLTYNLHYPIVFPMNDMGEFRGWVSRTMNPIIQKKRKYLYNEGFRRRDTLVGRYDNKTVVLVEGFMDYLKMKQFGVTYVAAILGWKVTATQVLKLKNQGVKTVISALDMDECGEKGTKELIKYFNVVRFQFPEGVKDPGDLDKETFKEANTKTKKLFKKRRI